MLLPDQDSPTPHILVVAGKSGTIYVVDRDNMGKFDSAGGNALQEINNSSRAIFGAPAFWNDNVYYVPRQGGFLQAYSVNQGLLSSTPVAQTATTVWALGMPSISANGTNAGIVWLLRGLTYSTPTLVAFDATKMKQIYSSSQATNNRDAVGAIAHFATPTIANGKVYVGTTTQLLVYGLLP